jgi:hypothetical protein
VLVQAAAHDCAPVATVTPGGIFLPTLGELCVYGVTSQVPSDGVVDRLSQWWEAVRERVAHLTTLGITLNHGPEHHRRRPQCMQRLVTFVPSYPLTVRLAYSPPSHRKYNPIERCWGILENHWKGAWLDSLDTILQFATTMTWQGTPPLVAWVTTLSQTGVPLTKDAMEAVEAQLTRLPTLGTWFIDIVPPSLAIRDTELFLSPLGSSTWDIGSWGSRRHDRGLEGTKSLLPTQHGLGGKFRPECVGVFSYTHRRALEGYR